MLLALRYPCILAVVFLFLFGLADAASESAACLGAVKPVGLLFLCAVGADELGGASLAGTEADGLRAT